MSREPKTLAWRERCALVAAPLAAATLLLAGCGSGQITQTDTQQAAVNGASGQAGPIALRDVQVAFPTGSNGYYQQGADLPLLLTIVNTGGTDATLRQVSSDDATAATITGQQSIPARTAVSSGIDPDDLPSISAAAIASSAPVKSATPTKSAAPSSANSSTSSPSSATATASAAPTSAAAGSVPSITIVLKGLKAPAMHPGQTIPVTFTFTGSGTVTIQVPIAAPTAAQESAVESANQPPSAAPTS